MINTNKHKETAGVFILMSIMLAAFSMLINNANTMYKVRDFKIDKLETLNKSTNGLERAQFKELELCVRMDSTLANDTVAGMFILTFSPERGVPAFNAIVDKCLIKLKHQAIYQQLSITNINQVQDAITHFKTIELK